MAYGKIEYNDEGKPKCEICGEHFDRIGKHVHDIHGISARDYKKQFGFNLQKGICSKESSKKTSDKVLKNYDRSIKNNIIKKGAETRFKKGNSSRPTNKISQETKNKMSERFNDPEFLEKMKEVGRKVGNSGLGNKVRHGKKDK